MRSEWPETRLLTPAASCHARIRSKVSRSQVEYGGGGFLIRLGAPNHHGAVLAVDVADVEGAGEEKCHLPKPFNVADNLGVHDSPQDRSGAMNTVQIGTTSATLTAH